SFGNSSTPYSIVSSISEGSNLIPEDMKENEILINSWLAEDLGARTGNEIELKYFVFGNRRNLEERSEKFRIRGILPLKGPIADQELMPDFPGLSGVNNCRDWNPGVSIDLHKIRKKDEEYWDLYRGTPKAFINLKTGQRLWGNRFGDLTAIRYPIPDNIQLVDFRSQIEETIKKQLDPASIGLFFQPVREQALIASSQALDFGQLFLGLSFFLIMAALLLTGLLFAFGIEHRIKETGTLLALGIPGKKIRLMFLYEGLILALIGSIIGCTIGILYTKITLYALSTVWRGAVGMASFNFHANSLTLITGTLFGIVIGLIAIVLVLWRHGKRPVRELLSGELDPEFKEASSKFISRVICFMLCFISGILALVIIAISLISKDARAVGAFFGAGTLLLICLISLSNSYLRRRSRLTKPTISKISSLGFRNTTRRRWRSLATIAILACGSFLIMAIGANRHDASIDAEKRQSGTGGFALYGESALPVLHDLNTEAGEKAYRLENIGNLSFVQMRVHDGEDASCLNLNRVQNPNLMGVNPDDLIKREAFKFLKTNVISHEPWQLLKANENEDIINAIGDHNTISWALGKSVGELIPYTDERGKPFQIRIVGSIASSVLQGSFIISEDEFIKRFPSESGYRVFLIDAPFDKLDETSKAITMGMRDVGIDLTSTSERLAAFNTVENTYLSIFQALGGLALLLGSVGLGIVVLRNVMERRGELAIMRAVGFQKDTLKWLILSEHWLLLVLGLFAGVIAGLVSIIPMIQSPGAGFPYFSMALTLCSIFLSGILWIWASTTLALRERFLDALRNE
ncbi:ABC transporter permease, partial [Candidatus Poribacteria bacterium]|nr:ABC transporter permease [Candidatus Poribacteria bacterium]